MSTYILVPGLWLGAWAWRDVTAHLRAAGHEVHPLTLTGLADRRHLAGTGVTLDTHIDDIVRLILAEDLHDVVLVGHSGGGVPVTGAADRVPERIRKIVYLDSGPLPDGASLLDANEPEGRAFIESRIAGGAPYPFPAWEEHRMLGASDEGLDEEVKRSVAARATPHPAGAITRPLRLTGAADRLPKALVTCSFPLDEVKALIAQGHALFAPLASPEWELLEVPTGHWPMFSRPTATAEALASV